MFFIKLIKVQDLICLKFKHNKTFLMLYNKIEINELERFMQAIEIEIHISDCFTQTRASIHILELFSEIYIQKKTFR